MTRVVCKYRGSNADEWGIAMCWLALREKDSYTHNCSKSESDPCPREVYECSGCTYQDKEACVSSFQQWRTGCCQVGSGKGGERINTRFTARTSPFQHCWHVLDMLPSLTITSSEPRVKSNFHPSDSCWIVLHSQSYCLHLHFPRNYYPGINWKWRSSDFSLFPRDFGVWSMTICLQPDGGQHAPFYPALFCNLRLCNHCQWPQN